MGYREMIKAALIGGVVTGVLVLIFSFLPIFGSCSCFLYLLSGIITGYLLTQEYLPSDRDYLISGALSGGIAGFVSWLIDMGGILLSGTVTSTDIDLTMAALLLLIGALISIIIGAAFGVIGAILYRIWIEKK